MTTTPHAPQQPDTMASSESPMGTTRRPIIDIGIFAHNEANVIAGMLTRLLAQDIFRTGRFSVNVYVLANGCTDQTAAKAAEAARALADTGSVIVCDLPAGGKSRTWNAFVHDISRADADVLVFCDADIDIPNADMLSAFATAFLADDRLRALNSHPVKDLHYQAGQLNPLEKLIASGANSLGNWRNEICGQLYALRPAFARTLYLPIGLPVEDGFVRAMVLTDKLQEPEDFTVIDGIEGLFHIYNSERTLGSLIRHQTRIVIGSAINAALFGHLVQLEKGAIPDTLRQASLDEHWLSNIIKSSLPRWPQGWVPLHYLIKRSARQLRSPKELLRPRALAVFVAGFGLDMVVYIQAQYKMATGSGAGYW